MIPLSTVRRVCLVHQKVDFRLGHDGLLGESYKVGLRPYEGDLVIFVGRRRRSLKILLFDGGGLWMLYKKFKEGSLRGQFKFLSDATVSCISLAEVSLLLEGTSYTLNK